MRPVLLVILSFALVACSAAPPPPASEIPWETSPPPPACPPPGVRITVAGADAAMGLRTVTLQMVNCGSKPYAVKGYPVVRVLDEDKKPIDVTVGHGSGGVSMLSDFDGLVAATVTLTPGEKAVAGLGWRNLVTDSTVVATTGHYLEVAPAPGAPAQTFVPTSSSLEVDGARTLTIDLGNTRNMGSQPWTKAAK